jgi:iron complex transport system permease protein
MEQNTKNLQKKIILLCFLPVIVFFLSLFLGIYPISPGDVGYVLLSPFFNLNLQGYELQKSVIVGIRMPRVLLAMLVGAGLAISGAACQGIFKNPLVSPDLLGVSAGAGFGAVLGILLVGNGPLVTMSALFFGIISVVIVFAISKINNTTPILSLVLAGIIVSSIFAALIALVKYVADPYDKLPTIVYWLMGSFAKASYDDLMLVIIPISVGMIILLFLRWRINILSLGDDEASSLGEKPERMRWLIIISVTVIAASAVTVAGIIGWVGLVIPHICRMIMGVDHKLLLPATILIGASFLAAIDIIARTATPAEIPIGILTAIIGAPFFALLLNRMKRGWI